MFFLMRQSRPTSKLNTFTLRSNVRFVSWNRYIPTCILSVGPSLASAAVAASAATARTQSSSCGGCRRRQGAAPFTAGRLTDVHSMLVSQSAHSLSCRSVVLEAALQQWCRNRSYAQVTCYGRFLSTRDDGRLIIVNLPLSDRDPSIWWTASIAFTDWLSSDTFMR